MKPVKFKFVSALVLSGFFAMASAQMIEPSGISFKVAGSDGFPILDTGAGSILDYDLSNNRVDFKVGATGSLDDPFFCFDFSDPGTAAVTLNATDANGHVVMDSVGLASELTYNLADIIAFSPSSLVQCFYKSTQTIDGQEVEVFGPFGQQASATRNTGTGDDGNSVFADNFAVYPDLVLSYESFHIVVNEDLVSLDAGLAVADGDELLYELVLENQGNGEADSIALQEVFPSNGAFNAGLTEGGWGCQDNWDNLLCPEDEMGALRLQDISLPAGGRLTFTVSRFVQADSTGQIHLFAGAVNGPGASAESAVAKVTLDVIGAPSGIAFVSQPDNAAAGFDITDTDGNDIVVQVVDDNSNHVPSYESGGIRLELYQNGSYVTDLTSRISVVDGEVTFQNLSTDDQLITAGESYTLFADHNDLNAQAESDPFDILPN